MAKVVHFEIPVDDAERARAFYRDVFGWRIEGWGEEAYWLVTAGAEEERGVDGALIGRGDIHASPVVVIGVEDLDGTVAQAEAAGATVLQGRHEIPGIGSSAYLRDPEGNTIGLFQPAG